MLIIAHPFLAHKSPFRWLGFQAILGGAQRLLWKDTLHLNQSIKGTVASAADLRHYPHSVCGILVLFSSRAGSLKGQRRLGRVTTSVSQVRTLLRPNSPVAPPQVTAPAANQTTPDDGVVNDSFPLGRILGPSRPGSAHWSRLASAFPPLQPGLGPVLSGPAACRLWPSKSDPEAGRFITIWILATYDIVGHPRYSRSVTTTS